MCQICALSLSLSLPSWLIYIIPLPKSMLISGALSGVLQKEEDSGRLSGNDTFKHRVDLSPSLLFVCLPVQTHQLVHLQSLSLSRSDAQDRFGNEHSALCSDYTHTLVTV